MLTPQMDEIRNTPGGAPPVVPVTARMAWLIGLVISGTVNSIAAADETLTADAIYTADLAASGNKVIIVPPNTNYMEIGAWGASATLSANPVLEFWRSHGVPANGRTAGADVWSKLYNLLGSASITLDGTIVDTRGAASATRYVIDEGTYNKHVFDLRGARIVVVRLTTKGASGNWSLWHRFF